MSMTNQDIDKYVADILHEFLKAKPAVNKDNPAAVVKDKRDREIVTMGVALLSNVLKNLNDIAGYCNDAAGRPD
jgi:hypothetical protein